MIGILLDGKGILRLALAFLIESLRNHPDKYDFLINNTSLRTTTRTGYSSQYYLSYMPRQLTPIDYYYYNEAYKAILLEAEKLYNKLAKDLMNKIIADAAYYNTSLAPLLSPNDDEKPMYLLQLPTAAVPISQAYTYRREEEHRFIQSEIDNENQDN